MVPRCSSENLRRKNLPPGHAIVTKKTTTDNRTFRDSIVPTVHLKGDEVCSLKRHYRNVLREVIGWLEHKAKLDPGRFVAFTIPSLTKACNRYKDKSPYKQRAVEYAVSFLRD